MVFENFFLRTNMCPSKVFVFKTWDEEDAVINNL